jgi:hypothetical protein
MDKELEIIFNLFIYEFMDCYYLGEKIEIDSEITYKTLLGLSQFKLLKDCFPVGERAWSSSLMGKFNYIIED